MGLQSSVCLPLWIQGHGSVQKASDRSLVVSQGSGRMSACPGLSSVVWLSLGSCCATERVDIPLSTESEMIQCLYGGIRVTDNIEIAHLSGNCISFFKCTLPELVFPSSQLSGLGLTETSSGVSNLEQDIVNIKIVTVRAWRDSLTLKNICCSCKISS